MRKMFPAIAAALFVGQPASAAEPLSEPVTAEWVVASFKSLCFDPFGDRAALTARVAASDADFVQVEPAQPMPGSTGWQSPKALLGYTDGTFLPRDLPSPQCRLSVSAAPGYDHAATAAALAGALGLPPAKAKGKNGRFQSEWNLAGPKGEKRRIFLSQEPAAGAVRVNVSLLNLR